ncbi:glycosyltransferase family 2 protein [Saccharothrix coeruleofusca]|uniref:Dolichol-phosphate mannosyltransferase n=1 Tax=Saccharothrix coeruleofusca TaxID=33919 RepID=A0A918AHH0_9PSEU|nr:glycosyltransferase family 2 protein [Saccharothrix coeruleofusca]GGP37184.1 dolichol-phosphate mannosyltransferase [Saccharothrix coeruleofusca]
MDGAPTARRKITYIFPIYNEQDNIDLLHKTIDEVTTPLQARYDLEFIYVNDGSRDASLDKLLELRERDQRATVISLSRNFGHQIAVTAGLDAASDADAVIIMDADMQDPPRVSLELIERWEQGVDVVYAQRRTRKDTLFKKVTANALRRTRKDTLFKKVTANAFYRTLEKLSSIDIPRNTGDFRLLDRKVVAELAKYREQHRFLRGLVSYVGFRQEAVQFDRDARHAGETGYPLRKMLKFAADGMLGFSVTPLRLISRMGYAISLLSFLGVLYVLGVRLFSPESAVPGWAFVTVAMFLLGGIQLIMLGVLGSYIGRTYVEVQRRPLYAVAIVARSGRVEPAPASRELQDA